MYKRLNITRQNSIQFVQILEQLYTSVVRFKSA